MLLVLMVEPRVPPRPHCAGAACYTTAELQHMQRNKTAHRFEGGWYPGPHHPTVPAPCSMSPQPSQDTLLPWLLGVSSGHRTAPTMDQWCCPSQPLLASGPLGFPTKGDHPIVNVLMTHQAVVDIQDTHNQEVPLTVTNTSLDASLLSPVRDPLPPELEPSIMSPEVDSRESPASTLKTNILQLLTSIFIYTRLMIDYSPHKVISLISQHSPAAMQ